MASADFATLLRCNRTLKKTVHRVAPDFVRFRNDFIHALPTSSQIEPVQKGTTTSFHERFRQISDQLIQEESHEKSPALVVFGANSCGKTTFIQCFLKIGEILPPGIGPVTARIVKLTYAPGDRASIRIYATFEASLEEHPHLIEPEINLAPFFHRERLPDWEDIANILLNHVQRPNDLDVQSDAFAKWAQCFVEIRLPSPVLELGIDVYDTPGFLSDNREQVLTDNLHKLVKSIKPTLVFLYDNATVSDADKSCFLAMKNALIGMETPPVFFLNTKADVFSIVDNYKLDSSPENVSMDDFQHALQQKRQLCYTLLLKQREMANELLGEQPELIDDCVCFDICTVPGELDPWYDFADVINTLTFKRIVSFAVRADAAPTLKLLRSILATTNDFFDFALSATYRTPSQWEQLCTETIEWGKHFFNQFKELLPTLTDDMHANILHLFDTQKADIAARAAQIVRQDDPIQILLRDSSKRVRDYVRIAVEEQVIKVAANETIINTRDRVKATIGVLFEPRHRHKNELLNIAQRQVLGDISAAVLQHQTFLEMFIDNIIKFPLRAKRWCRSLPTRITTKATVWYNEVVHHGNDDTNEDEDSVFNLLDALDAYANLSNVAKRQEFAERYVNMMRQEIENQKDSFHRNLILWLEQQQTAFNANTNSNLNYIQAHLSEKQIVHNLVQRFAGPFADIECRLFAALDLVEFKDVPPTIGKIIGTGAFYSVHMAEWDHERDLAVKKLLRPIADHPYMASLEAHSHRIITLSRREHIVPLLYLYENDQDLWIIMPRYVTSLREYLCQHIHTMTFPRAISFAQTIARVLADLHQDEIVHRDIKSSNILLDNNEQCFLADFGTVKESLLNKTIVGTTPLTPEMIALLVQSPDTATVYDGSAVDIYAFGLLLYELLPKGTYHQPTEVRTPDNMRHLLLDLARSPLYCLYSSEYEALIYDCLEPIPAARPRAAKVVERLDSIQRNAESKPCTVCEDRMRNVRFMPCGHKLMCNECWLEWSSQERPFHTSCILCKATVINHTEDNVDATFYAPV